MMGVLLAGGTGSRMGDLTKAVNKHLLPVYDQPMIYYPLRTLLDAGIDDVIVVADPGSLEPFREQLGNGSQWSMRIRFAAQQSPNGLVDAIRSAADLLGASPFAVALGDNVFLGREFQDVLRSRDQTANGAQVFAVQVEDPKPFAVLELDNGAVTSLREKPANTTSNWIVPGLYFYDSTALLRTEAIQRSDRGEFEITDLNRSYLDQKQLDVTFLNQEVQWYDAGTPEKLHEASIAARSCQRAGVPYGMIGIQ